MTKLLDSRPQTTRLRWRKTLSYSRRGRSTESLPREAPISCVSTHAIFHDTLKALIGRVRPHGNAGRCYSLQHRGTFRSCPAHNADGAPVTDVAANTAAYVYLDDLIFRRAHD